MLSSTPENDTNAVLIEFNSLVGGPGIYSNLATLSYSGLQVTAADSVRVTSDFSNLPETGFAPYVRTDLGKDQPVLYTQTGGITVEIPSLNVNIPIVGVPLVDGQWDVTWLGNQAGWLEGSAFPSWSGNSVLTSHVYDADGLPGPFIDLKELRYGDQVVIHVEEQTYTFEVQTNRILDPDDLSVFEHEEQAWITLVTCKDYDEITDTYGKRVVVRAVLVSVTR
jgi:LPXTG-site transpeptidase (sortase) family protein